MDLVDLGRLADDVSGYGVDEGRFGRRGAHEMKGVHLDFFSDMLGWHLHKNTKLLEYGIASTMKDDLYQALLVANQ